MKDNRPKFTVVVGNIGTVYEGNNYMVASCKFAAYKKQSHSGSGRAGDERVVLCNGGLGWRLYDS